MEYAHFVLCISYKFFAFLKIMMNVRLEITVAHKFAEIFLEHTSACVMMDMSYMMITIVQVRQYSYLPPTCIHTSSISQQISMNVIWVTATSSAITQWAVLFVRVKMGMH